MDLIKTIRVNVSILHSSNNYWNPVGAGSFNLVSTFQYYILLTTTETRLDFKNEWNQHEFQYYILLTTTETSDVAFFVNLVKAVSILHSSNNYWNFDANTRQNAAEIVSILHSSNNYWNRWVAWSAMKKGTVSILHSSNNYWNTSTTRSPWASKVVSILHSSNNYWNRFSKINLQTSFSFQYYILLTTTETEPWAAYRA